MTFHADNFEIIFETKFLFKTSEIFVVVSTMGEYLRDESPKRGGKSARLEGCTGAESRQGCFASIFKTTPKSILEGLKTSDNNLNEKTKKFVKLLGGI